MRYAFTIFGATFGVLLVNLGAMIFTDTGGSAETASIILVVGASAGILAWAFDDAKKAIVAAIWAVKEKETTTAGTTAE